MQHCSNSSINILDRPVTLLNRFLDCAEGFALLLAPRFLNCSKTFNRGLSGRSGIMSRIASSTDTCQRVLEEYSKELTCFMADMELVLH